MKTRKTGVITIVSLYTGWAAYLGDDLVHHERGTSDRPGRILQSLGYEVAFMNADNQDFWAPLGYIPLSSLKDLQQLWGDFQRKYKAKRIQSLREELARLILEVES